MEIVFLELILQDRPELDAIAGHQAHRPLDRGEVAEGGELIEQVEDRGRGLARRSHHVLQALRDHQAKPAGIGSQASGRQHQEHRRDARFRSPNAKSE